ncbi:hypothetical protein JHK87_012003 [Glycine soja]|nr:hypothetical protein JHK87_012003 [Glycine soja]
MATFQWKSFEENEDHLAKPHCFGVTEIQSPHCTLFSHNLLHVLQVVKKKKSLKRISFLAHSLGGLYARYTIVVLYSPDTYDKDQPGDLANNMTKNSQGTSFQEKG